MNLYRPSYSSLDQSVPESVLKSLNKTQQKIIDIIFENPKVTQNDVAKQLKLSLSAVKKSMKEMSEVGVLERIGSIKGGYWRVIIKKG